MNAIVGFTALAITHVDEKEQVEEYLKKIIPFHAPVRTAFNWKYFVFPCETAL